jgi:VanZ family protein
MKQLRRKILFPATILVGFGFSLVIELIQVYLPSRDSSLTDVICNTIGTIAGLILFITTFYSIFKSRKSKLY